MYIDDILNICDNDIIEIEINEERFDCRYGVTSIPDELLDTPIESFMIKEDSEVNDIWVEYYDEESGWQV